VLNIPLSIILIHYISINALLFFIRVLIKMFYEMVSLEPSDRKNVVIYGAGSMGILVTRVITSDKWSQYHIVAFVDNDKKLQGKSLEGIPVFGPKKLGKKFLEKYCVETMIFAIKDIKPSEKSEVFRFAVDLGLEVLEVPAVDKWLDGKFQLDQLEKIKLQDLLSREPIQMNMRMIERGLRNQTIMITGAAGSIGSEIIRQLTRFNIKELILIDNAETPMFHLGNELREHYPYAPVRSILADITDQLKMDRIFAAYSPEILFHAAAYKHVPMMEKNPHEAIRVNVGGTVVLTKLALKYHLGKFVMVSTDKAVNPTNVMGASKRICEMVLQARTATPDNNTQFVITRFGNVLGSNGSVIPLFRKQIEEGGPVTVTHPEISRYFMTISEACQLVLEAGFMGMGGEIFVFEMGKPIKIVDLARQMIRLSGYVPDKDIKIEFIGMRPGEKLCEELLDWKEKTMPTYNPKVKVAEVARMDHQTVLSTIHMLLYTAPCMSEMELITQIHNIVPEYKSTNERFTGRSGDAESINIESYPD
jgi:FlaA1/EpsC-like NDP-sugar epimerase